MRNGNVVSYAKDISFVVSEVKRFENMPLSERVKLDAMEVLATLPKTVMDPSSLGCGREAEIRLYDMAKLAISRSRYAGRLDPESVRRNLKKAINKRFVVDEVKIDTREAGKVVAAAVRWSANSIGTLTHFIPCHIDFHDNPKRFEIGPVEFIRCGLMIEEIDHALNSYIDNCDKSRFGILFGNEYDHRTKMVRYSKEYYESFGWVAKIVVDGCDAPTSRKCADRIVQNALDCLHLLVGAGHTNHMRAGGPNHQTDRRGRIELDATGQANVSISTDWLTNDLGEDWWEERKNDGGQRLIELMGIAIESGQDIADPAPLAQRFLDGVSWYGEAARDKFVASKIIKFVLAMERILITSNKSVSKVFEERGVALIYQDGDNLRELRDRFKKLYALRSRLAHGSLSPLDPQVGLGLREADRLSRFTLLCALCMFEKRGLQNKNINISKLEAAYSQIINLRNNIV